MLGLVCLGYGCVIVYVYVIVLGWGQVEVSRGVNLDCF